MSVQEADGSRGRLGNEAETKGNGTNMMKEKLFR